jgi:potassium/hydrogen antiporter
LLSYRVVKDSAILRGERIPRWATPSLVIRDGRSMRYQYAGRLKENDLIYIFISPHYSRLLDRLFASRALVDPEDAEFFGAFAISPQRHAADLDAAYGPGLLNDSEKTLTIAELMKQRLGGKADYADRVRLGSIILIVRELDENDHIQSVGMSLEAVEPATSLPIFINLRDLAGRIRDTLKRRSQQRADAPGAASGAGEKSDA